MQSVLSSFVCHPDFILNMDQTLIPFTFNVKKTLELIGTKTINVCKSTYHTKRATFAMTITASGNILTPMLVFKGERNGRIVRHEFRLFEKTYCTLVKPTLGWMSM